MVDSSIITNQLPQYTPNIDTRLTRESPQCYTLPLDAVLAILTQVRRVVSPPYTPLLHHHCFSTYAPYALTMTSHSLDDRDACLNQGYCHDSVYDALFLTLTPTQAIAGLTLTSTPHNTQPLMTHHLIYAYRLTHLYLPSHITPS